MREGKILREKNRLYVDIVFFLKIAINPQAIQTIVIDNYKKLQYEH